MMFSSVFGVRILAPVLLETFIKALCGKGVNTFIDDKLRKGEEITPALMKAIQESGTAIVVFSQDYASSRFCLEELTEIMECLKHKGRLVWPVFYKVDPSDVRHQKGSYGQALAKHETRITDKDKVNKWRLALQEAANLSGWHYKQGYQYEFIGDIIQEVSKRIKREALYVAKYPLGLESRVHKVMSLLDVESNEGVHMVGIYGIGGIGKTTLACAVYNFIADQFEGLSFLADIRGNSVNNGLVQLQEKLLSDILGDKDIKLGSTREGIPIIKSRLCKKKMLLILDDVDKKEQLEVLAGGLDWFGSGSRIIISTKDIHLLHLYGVDRTYEAEGLNHEEALELFSWNAFRIKEVDPIYQGISERLILHSNGLPLSVEIIGSDLIGKSVLECNSALDAYERIPHPDIQKILRVSYDGLEEFQKEAFLDIACFFKGYIRSNVTNILHICRGSTTEYAIRVLIDKCLIQIANGYVRMHNLIETMGKEIVRQESPLNPGERSRLWFSKDILRVFKENKGSDKTQIIMLHFPKYEDVQWNGNALKKMEKLKILVVKNARFSRAPTALPKSLRVLRWSGYPESSLPAGFDPRELVILDLSQSFFTFKNKLNLKFESLTKMNLNACEFLKEIPDMSQASNLKVLDLGNCKNLVKVDDSVGFLHKLERLNLFHCTSLRVLPHGMNLPSLVDMDLTSCRSLMSFPEILGKMEKTILLNLTNTGIRNLPFSIGNLIGLIALLLNRCKWLIELPSSIFMLPNLEFLNTMFCERLAQIQNGNSQDQETMSPSLELASFNECHLTDKFLGTLVPCLGNVTALYLERSNITFLPSSISACLSLSELQLGECKELREIRGLPPNLKYLSAVNCTSLSSESQEMLLNQTLHEAGGRHFEFPGSIIPSWMNFSSRGPSLRFWFRNKFPAFTICVNGFDDTTLNCFLPLNINGMPKYTRCNPHNATNYVAQTNHTILSDRLTNLTSFERLHIKKGWNSVEISFEKYWPRKIGIEWIGVHVQEHKTNMEDIRFTNPDISVAEKQILNQNITADREGSGPSLLRRYMELLESTKNNNPESGFAAYITALLNKMQKYNDDL